MNDNMDAMKAIESELNGVGVVGNPDVIGILEEFLAQAKAGKIHGVAVVAVLGPEALMARSGGVLPCTLAVGLERVKQAVIEGVFAQKPSPILRPGRAM